MFKDEVSKNTLKKRRDYYLKHGIKNVFPCGLLESSSLDITTPYMLRNDGELLKCGDIHPYIKSHRKESLEETLKYLDLHKSFLDWFYNNSLNEETRTLIKNFDRTKETIDRLWCLTNQEFCRVRTSNYRYKTGGDNGEIYFRISSEDFNWFDLIWNTCVKYSPSIDYITIMKDPQVFGKQFDYIKIGGEKMNKYPLKSFIELEGEPLVESLLLEDLPLNLKRKLHNENYIIIRTMYDNSDVSQIGSIYPFFINYSGLDPNKSSFEEVDKNKLLELLETLQVTSGSIVCGNFKDVPVVFLQNKHYPAIRNHSWTGFMSVDLDQLRKLGKITRKSVTEYLSSQGITKSDFNYIRQSCESNSGFSKLINDNNLDDLLIYICKGISFEHNNKSGSRDNVDAVQGKFNKILASVDINLKKINTQIKKSFDIEHLAKEAYALVPNSMKSQYKNWLNHRFEKNFFYVFNNLIDSRKNFSDAKKKFKLDPTKKNKNNLLKAKTAFNHWNSEYLNDFVNDEIYFDTEACYFILKTFINEIKKLNNSLCVEWKQEDNENNRVISNLKTYIDTLKTLQRTKENASIFNDFNSLSSIPGWKDINKKIDDVLNDSMKKAEELANRIKNDNITDIEYNILRFVVNLVENLKYKLETILDLKQSMKENLNKDLNINEDIEKHEELNPLLFEDDELKPEIKEAIEKIVDQFVEDLKTDGVKIEVKDVILVGSNVSYNYTKDSDLDIHIIVDKDELDCDPELYTLLYGAYRSLFNKNYDITIKGIPVEIYVELE